MLEKILAEIREREGTNFSLTPVNSSKRLDTIASSKRKVISPRDIYALSLCAGLFREREMRPRLVYRKERVTVTTRN